MAKTQIILFIFIMSGLLLGCSNNDFEKGVIEPKDKSTETAPIEVAPIISDEVSSEQDSLPATKIRVPAEWEFHAATWIQWPGRYEAKMRPAFVEVIKVIQEYEQVQLLTSSEREKTEAIELLTKNGVSDQNITWHIVLTDSAWMRDNGPIYITDGINTWIQNWKFNAWGGNFGSEVSFQNDNRVPTFVGEYLNIKVEDHQEYVLEKGNLESNGAGVLVLGWDCQNDRNPGMTRKEHETILKEALGATQILWAYGHWKGEGTTGHIDATARFIDQNTLVVADYKAPIDCDGLATTAEDIGLNVVRYAGDLNWLVGNGFVLAMSEGSKYDQEAKSQLAEFFPGREVFLIDGDTLAAAGGGIHCITNDQPEF